MFRVALTRVCADFNKRYEVSLNTFSVWQDEDHMCPLVPTSQRNMDDNLDAYQKNNREKNSYPDKLGYAKT